MFQGLTSFFLLFPSEQTGAGPLAKCRRRAQARSTDSQAEEEVQSEPEAPLNQNEEVQLNQPAEPEALPEQDDQLQELLHQHRDIINANHRLHHRQDVYS